MPVLVDVEDHPFNNKMLLTIREQGPPLQVWRPWRASFFVEDTGLGRSRIEKILRDDPRTDEVWTRTLPLGPAKPPSPALEVRPKVNADLYKLALDLERAADFEGVRLYDVDVKQTSKFLTLNKLFPAGLCDFRAGHIQMTDDARRFPLPELGLKSKTFRVEVAKGVLVRSADTPIVGVRVGDEHFTREPSREEELLREVAAYVRKSDLDLLVTDGGDGYDFPAWFDRIKHFGLVGHVNLGRFRDRPRFGRSGGVFVGGYGTVHRNASWPLSGGPAHLDVQQANLGLDTAIPAILQQARHAALPLQVANRVGGGTTISQLAINVLHLEGIPTKLYKDAPPVAMTYNQLQRNDRGSLTIMPPPGVVYDVHGGDWVSAFAHFMVLFNLSVDTIDTPAAQGSSVRIPTLDVPVDMSRQGISAKVVWDLLQQRLDLMEKLLADPPAPVRAQFQVIYDKLKQCLVTAFGREGYENHDNGDIRAHEGIMAVDRLLLPVAKKVAEKRGWQVKQAIVDSLIFHRPGSSESEARDTLKAVAEATRVPMKYEGHFHALLNFPTQLHGASALNKYILLAKKGGKHRIKGIEYAQHSTPPFLKRMQADMVDELATGLPGIDIHDNVPLVLAVAKRCARELKDGHVDARLLRETFEISKYPEEYTTRGKTWAAMSLAFKEGLDRDKGQTLRYLVIGNKEKAAAKKVRLGHHVEEDTPYDAAYYVKEVVKVTATTLLPLGWNRERVAAALSGLAVQGYATEVRLEAYASAGQAPD